MIDKLKEYYSKISHFLSEVKTEGKKVSWPKREQLIAATSLVIFAVVIITLFLALVDYIFTLLFRLIQR